MKVARISSRPALRLIARWATLPRTRMARQHMKEERLAVRQS